jgi:hypothetical protein
VSAPPKCCIAGADGQPWPCRSEWVVAFRRGSLDQPDPCAAQTAASRPRLFRKAGQRPGGNGSARFGVAGIGGPGGRLLAVYPVASARLCCQSLRRLWVAVISRHSALQAHRPLRWNLSIRRLYLV